MRTYLIWAPPFDESSGGIKVMHRLAVELQKRGQVVYINTPIQNKKWPVVHVSWPDALSNTIAIYPEIVHGNPFNAKTVVRYLLNIPGACSMNTADSYGKDDILYTYSHLFNTKLELPEDRVMLCPHIDTKVFRNKKLTRSGRLVYRGKGKQLDKTLLAKVPSLGGKEDFRGDDGQSRLSEALNRCELLYCYDMATAMTEIARLCGCPVVIIPDNSYTWQEYRKFEFWVSGGLGFGLIETPLARLTINSNQMFLDYVAAEEDFQRKLTEFIEITQKC